MQKAQPVKAGLFLCSGSPTWTRTRDLRINSPSLYQLSYQGKEAALYLLNSKLASPEAEILGNLFRHSPRSNQGRRALRNAQCESGAAALGQAHVDRAAQKVVAIQWVMFKA